MPVDPTQTPQAVMDPQGSAIQMPSAEDAASSPGGAAQQQKSAPAQAAPVAAPAASVGILPVTATSSSPHLHSFISRVLSAFAGTPPTQYTTDASGRVIPAPDQKPEPNINKVGRIISHALVGLSAPNPGGPPSILSGMGAGFAAQGLRAS